MEPQETPAKPKSAFELFSISSRIVQDNIKTFIVVSILSFLSALSSVGNGFTTPPEAVPEDASVMEIIGLPEWIQALGVGVILAITLAFTIISLILWTMMTVLVTESAQGKKPALGYLFSKAKKYWLRLLLLAIAIGLMVLGGLILFIVPGLIMIRRYFLAPYILIDKDTSIGEAMRESARLTKPYPGYIWSVLGVMFILSLPGFVPFIGGIISAVLGMLYSVAPALRYEELKKLVPVTQQ